MERLRQCAPKLSERMSGTTSIIDPQGDLTLIIGSSQSRALVSRKAMQLASPVWRAMLEPSKWREGTQNEVDLPEDDVQAMIVILNISHLKFVEVPGQFPLHRLAAIAILADKYDMAPITRPFLCTWRDNLKPNLLETEGDPDAIFITYIFKFTSEFKVLSRKFVEGIELDGEGRPCSSIQMPFITGGSEHLDVFTCE